jgi:hypothetical protein
MEQQQLRTTHSEPPYRRNSRDFATVIMRLDQHVAILKGIADSRVELLEK